MAGGIRIQAELSHINQQMKDMDKKFQAALRRELRAAVAQSGSEITAAVKAEASWSKGTQRPKDRKGSGRTSIPAATSLAVSFGAKKASIRLKVDAKKAPHARPLESGNAKGGGNVLRHPVYGRGGFANMPTRPFFFAAIQARTPGVDKKFEEALVKIAADAGFKGV